MSKLIFGYWKIRGLGQYLRHLLVYTGLEFEEVQYDNIEKWFVQDKPNLGFEFPNLPYLIDGDFKLTESAAIAHYIIVKSDRKDLLGKNTQDQAKVNNILGVINDGMKDIRNLYRISDYENEKNSVLEKTRSKFDYIRDFVGDKQWALGYLTLVDFVLAENLAYFQTLYLNQRKNYAFWWRIRRNFQELPEIKNYYKGPNAITMPYLPPIAAIQPSTARVRLGYWPIRGKAQVIRLLLSFAGVEFEDFVYTNSDKWFKDDKQNLGLKFPNLPYLLEGQNNISESSAIQRYVIQRWGNPQYLGKTIQDSALLDSFLSVFEDFSGAVRSLFFNKNHQIVKAEIIQRFKTTLQELQKFVGQKSFVLGYLTLADFIVAQDSYYIERVFPEEYKAYSFLGRIRENFNNLPQVKTYYSSEKAFKGKFFPPYAYISVEND